MLLLGYMQLPASSQNRSLTLHLKQLELSQWTPCRIVALLLPLFARSLVGDNWICSNPSHKSLFFPTLLSFYAGVVFGRELALPLYVRKPNHCQSRARTNGVFFSHDSPGEVTSHFHSPPPVCSMAAPNHKAGDTEGEHSWSMTGSVQVAPISRKRLSSNLLGASDRLDFDDTRSQ